MTKAEKLQLHRIMENLDCDEKTAKEIMETDKRIDKGEKLFELTKDQKQVEKQMRSTGTRKVDAYGKSTERKQKVDEDKIHLMEILTQSLGVCGNLNITNPQSTIELVYNGRKFKVVLSAPRK